MDYISPDLLCALAAVADARSFTVAAQNLGLRQSTVSQQIKRLESLVGRRLIDRSTHSAIMTPEGEALLEHARRILDVNERMHRHLSATSLRGRLRFGASEDFVLSALPDVLAAFARRFPEVDVELTAALSETLYEAFDAGSLDIIFVKKRERDPRGIVAWEERVAWVSRPDLQLEPGNPIPLLLYPPPSVTRRIAIETLQSTQRPWRIAFTSGSLSGLSAAARAGIGLMPHSSRLLPPGLGVVNLAGQLPQLPSMQFVIIGPSGRNPVSQALTDTILQWANTGHAVTAGISPSRLR